MTLFFFDVMGRSRCEYDSWGTLLSDSEEAYKWAQLIVVVLRSGGESQGLEGGRVRVRSPDGCELFSIPMRLLEADLDRGAAGWGEPTEGRMKSLVAKRSIMIGGRKSSVSLEEAFWKGLKEIASNCRVSLSELVHNINSGRHHSNLSSAIRLFVLDHYRTKIGAALGTRGPGDETRQMTPKGADAQRLTDPLLRS
jgi:predicted DNA-binding ribbon-helix-helix protein